MPFDHGVFTVSLDFELLWGVRETRTIESYGENLRGVRRAIPEMLRVFGASGIHATWATVGFLFHRDVAELKASLPDARPRYTRPGISPYEYIEAARELDPLYHFAPELIERIARQPGQAIGTHTYSHYYCLEEGQGVREFEADLARAVEVARRAGVYVRSIVFPRNQCNDAYLASLTRFGVLCYRGTQEGTPMRRPTRRDRAGSCERRACSMHTSTSQATTRMRSTTAIARCRSTFRRAVS